MKWGSAKFSKYIRNSLVATFLTGKFLPLAGIEQKPIVCNSRGKPICTVLGSI
jgi:hypothetical protein